MSQVAEDSIALKLLKPERCRVVYQIMKHGEPIGEIALDQIAWRSGEAELKISIEDNRLHNHGYGTEAILVLLDQAFRKMNLKRIYLRVHARNTVALRCYEKVGFKKEGRLQRRTEQSVREVIYLMGISNKDFLTQGHSKHEAV